MAGPTKILLTDTLKFGWRTKHNLNVDELIVSATDKGNGTAELVKFGGAKVVLNFLNSFFTKTQVNNKISESIAVVAGVKYSSFSGNFFDITIPQNYKLTTLDIVQTSGSPTYSIGISNGGGEIQPETDMNGSGSIDSFLINKGNVLSDTHIYVNCTNGEVKLVYIIIQDFYS